MGLVQLKIMGEFKIRGSFGLKPVSHLAVQYPTNWRAPGEIQPRRAVWASGGRLTLGCRVIMLRPRMPDHTKIPFSLPASLPCHCRCHCRRPQFVSSTPAWFIQIVFFCTKSLNKTWILKATANFFSISWCLHLNRFQILEAGYIW